MRRILIILLSGMLFVAPAIAQISSFNQRGKATREMNVGGLSIAHSSLPINTKVTVTNAKTGKQTEAVVVNRIGASPQRIADLSGEVWQTLELNPETDIIISTSPPPRTRSSLDQTTSSPVAMESAASPADPLTNNVPQFPSAAQIPPPSVNMNGNAYSDVDFLKWFMAMVMWDTREAREVREARAAREARDRGMSTSSPVIQSASVYQAQPVPQTQVQTQPVPQTQVQTQPVLQTQAQPIPQARAQVRAQAPSAPVLQPLEVQVIPGLPNPGSGKMYLLQVGAYSTPEGAAGAVQLLRGANFYVVEELFGDIRRVIAANIPAAMVYPAIQRLAQLGIRQIWIREQIPVR